MKKADRSATTVAEIQTRVVACRFCPELRDYTATIARVKKRAYLGETYWGKPVPAFGDANARVILVGLAPGAHGSNRTGRMFTGDASGEWLYRALHRAGFANQAVQRDVHDGMELHDLAITAALRCAPPGNKPSPLQLHSCARYLREEFVAFERMQVVVGLGAIGTRAAQDALSDVGYAFAKRLRFGHGAEIVGTHTTTGRSLTLLASYHPSRQNTNTGVLTEAMLDAIFTRASRLLER